LSEEAARKRENKARCAAQAYRALHFAKVIGMSFLQGFFKPNIEKLQSRRDVQSLIMALQYKEPTVRRAAAEVLGRIGDPCAVSSLLKAVKDDNQDVRSEAASALGKIGDPCSVEALIKLIDHKDKQVRHKTVESLVKICASSVEPLIVALEDKTNGPRVLCSVISILGRIGDVRAIAPLIAALKNHSQDVRQAAAEALGDLGEPRTAEPIIEALDHEHSYSCLVTGEALKKIGDPRAVELLIRALENGDCDVAWRAASALGKIGDPSGVEPLIKALDQGDGFLCLMAAEALGKIGDPRAIDSLVALHRGTSDHSVRDQARNALKTCGYQGSPVRSDELSDLKKLLDHSLDAKVFIRSTELLGFRVFREGPSGMSLESDKARLMLAVLTIIHPTDLARVVYTGKGEEYSITLVDDGRRKY
jgi:HEAT repeat protein